MGDSFESIGYQHNQFFLGRSELLDIIKFKFGNPTFVSNGSKCSNISTVDQLIIKYQKKYTTEEMSKFTLLFNDEQQIGAILEQVKFPIVPNLQLLNEIKASIQTQELTDVTVMGTLHQGIAWFAYNGDDKDPLFVPVLIEILTSFIQTEYVNKVVYLFCIVLNEYLLDCRFNISENLFNSVLNFVINCEDLTESFTDIFLAFYSKTLNSNLMSESINKLLEISKKFIFDKRQFFPYGKGSSIFQCIAPLIQKMNFKAIELLCTAASENDYFIEDICLIFELLAKSLIGLIFDNKPSNNITLKADLKLQDKLPAIKYEPFFKNSHEFAYDDSELLKIYNRILQASISIENYVPPHILKTLQLFSKFFVNVDFQYIDHFINKIIATAIEQKCTPYYVDYFAIILFLFTNLNEQIPITDYADFLLSPVIFDPDDTAFTKGDKSSFIRLRYLVFNMIIKQSQTILDELFIFAAKVSPYIFSEIALFTLAIFDHLKIDFFCTEASVRALMNTSTSVQDLFFDDPSEKNRLTRIVCIKFIFNLVENVESFSFLSSSEDFANGIVNLLFDQFLTINVMDMLTKGFANCKVTYSNPMYFQIITVFCTLLDICAKNNKDTNFYNLASEIIKCIYSSLLKNSLLIISFYQLLMPIFKFASKCPNPLFLNKFSAILSASAEHINSFHFTPEMFHITVEYVNTIEGKEPTDKFQLNCHSLLGGRKQKDVQSMFLMRHYHFLPLYLVSFSHSSKIGGIFDFFLELCKYSPYNCINCHKGDLDYFLIHFLQNQTEFKYNGYNVSFLLDFKESFPSILLLVSEIIKIKTSVSICDQLVHMIVPTSPLYRPTIDKNVMNMLLNVISEDINKMRPIFDMVTNKTILNINGLSDKIVNDDFAISFWIKIDVPQFSRVCESYTVACLEGFDKKSQFLIFVKKDKLMCWITFNTTKISTVLIDEIPPNEWINVTVEKISPPNQDTVLHVLKSRKEIKTVNCSSFAFSHGEISFTCGTSSSAKTVNTHIIVGELGPICFYKPKSTDKGQPQLLHDIDPNFENLPDPYFTTASIFNNKIQNQFEYSINNLFHNGQSLNDIFVENYSLNYLTYIYAKYRPEDISISLNFLEMILLSLASSVLAQKNFISVPLLCKTISTLYKGRLSYEIYLKLFKCFSNLKHEKLTKDFFDYLIMNMELWGSADFQSTIKIIQHWSIYANDYFKSSIISKSCNISRLLSMFEILFFSSANTEIVTELSCGVQITETAEDRLYVYSFLRNHSQEEVTQCKDKFYQFIVTIANMSLSAQDVTSIYAHLFASKNKAYTVELLKLISALSSIIKKIESLSFDIVAPVLTFFNSENEKEIMIEAIFAISNLAAEKIHIYLSTASVQILNNECFSYIFKVLINKIPECVNLYSLICVMALSLGQSEIEAAISVIKAINDNPVLVPEIETDLMWAVWPICLGLLNNKNHQKIISQFLSKQVFRFGASQFLPKFVDIYSLIFFLANQKKTAAYYLQTEFTLATCKILFEMENNTEIGQQKLIFLITALSSIFFYHTYFRNIALYKEFVHSPFCEAVTSKKNESKELKMGPSGSLTPRKSLPSLNNLKVKISQANGDESINTDMMKKAKLSTLPEVEKLPYNNFISLLKFVRPYPVFEQPLIFQLRIARGGEWVDKGLCEKIVECSKFLEDQDTTIELFLEVIEFMKNHDSPPEERDISAIDQVILVLQSIAVTLDPSKMLESITLSCEMAKGIISHGMQGLTNIIVSKASGDIERELLKLDEIQQQKRQNMCLIRKRYGQCRDSSLFLNKESNITYKRDNCMCFDLCPFKVRPEFTNQRTKFKLMEYRNNNNENKNRRDIETQTMPVESGPRRSSLEFSKVVDCNIIKVDHKIRAKFLISEKEMVIFIRRSHRLIYIKPYMIGNIFRRKMYQKDTALELFLTNGKSYFLDFFPLHNEEILAQITKMEMGNIQFLQLEKPQKFMSENLNYTSLWVNGYISNFTYLMILNMASGRSFNDPKQYPIFPLIYSDLEKMQKRNLSVPIDFIDKEENEKIVFESEIDQEIEFLFHPSPLTPSAVDGYMVRIEPFTTLHLKKQSGRIIEKSIFKNLSSAVISKTELTPEFFFFPEFLTNVNHINVTDFEFPSSLTNSNGNTSNSYNTALSNRSNSPNDSDDSNKFNSSENDIDKNSNDSNNSSNSDDPFVFIYQHRKLLESEEISQKLNQWIDLIWGCKQSGQNAIDNNNFRHPFILENAWETEGSFLIKADGQVLSMMKLYGLMPSQLFNDCHPKREIMEKHNTELAVYEIHSIPILAACNNFSDNGFVFVDQNEKAFKVEIKNGSASYFNKDISTVVVKLSKDIVFCSISKGMILLSQKKEFLSIFQNDSIKTFHFEVNYLDSICGSANYFATVCDRTIVTVYDTTIFPEKVGEIVVLDDAIFDCQINQQFSIVAILCRNGIIHLHSLSQMQRVNSIDLSKHHPRKVLITPRWGFILVECINKIMVFNVNGKLIKVADFPFDIAGWKGVSSLKDFDYVIFETAKRKIGVFEAFDPNNVKILSQVNSSICYFDYSRTQNCAYVLSIQGQLVIISHPFPND